MKRLDDGELIDELKKRFEENDELLNTLKVVNNKLMDVNKRLHESEALKSHFLSNIRNEIVNPLTSILCMSKAVMDGEISGEMVPSAAKTIHTEAFKLDSQLRNIFAAAELEAGEATPSISMVDVDTLVNGMIDLFIHKTTEKKIQVTYHPLDKSVEEAYFMTDPDKLQIILINLLSNAIEYSHEGGPVEINASIDGEDLNISVIDHGIGIDESDQGVIFDRFKQLESGAAKGHLGHGLGASVVKSMVELLNGTISLSSVKGEGSTFTVKIPKAKTDKEVPVFSGESNEFFFEVGEEQEF